MSLQYLLDTSIVSNPIAKAPNPTVIERLEREGATCAIAAPVWHELVYGVRRLPAGARRLGLERYLEDVVEPSFPILPYDERAAAWHGRERARLERAGKTPPFVDGQIAAIAHAQGLTLVTTNGKDFASFRGVRLADWTR
ncbi:MAG: putative nucleic acid-binding protein [Myxococcales bacterium]|nr:putative nucleic acid-binding protein [Myxococcales bacterium]